LIELCYLQQQAGGRLIDALTLTRLEFSRDSTLSAQIQIKGTAATYAVSIKTEALPSSLGRAKVRPGARRGMWVPSER